MWLYQNSTWFVENIDGGDVDLCICRFNGMHKWCFLLPYQSFLHCLVHYMFALSLRFPHFHNITKENIKVVKIMSSCRLLLRSSVFISSQDILRKEFFGLSLQYWRQRYSATLCQLVKVIQLHWSLSWLCLCWKMFQNVTVQFFIKT